MEQSVNGLRRLDRILKDERFIVIADILKALEEFYGIGRDI